MNNYEYIEGYTLYIPYQENYEDQFRSDQDSYRFLSNLKNEYKENVKSVIQDLNLENVILIDKPFRNKRDISKGKQSEMFSISVLKENHKTDGSYYTKNLSEFWTLLEQMNNNNGLKI